MVQVMSPPPRRRKLSKKAQRFSQPELLSFIDQADYGQILDLGNRLGVSNAQGLEPREYINAVRTHVEKLGSFVLVPGVPTWRSKAWARIKNVSVPDPWYVVLALCLVISATAAVISLNAYSRANHANSVVHNRPTVEVATTTTAPPRTNPSVAPATTTTLKPTTTVPATTTTTDCVPMPGKSSKQLSNGICLYS